jgi:hypothetical protein
MSYDVFAATVDTRETLRFYICDYFRLYLLKLLCLYSDEPLFKLLPKTDGVDMFALDFPVKVIRTIAVPRIVLVKHVIPLIARLRMNRERPVVNFHRLKALFDHGLPAQDAGRLLRGCMGVHVIYLQVYLYPYLFIYF